MFYAHILQNLRDGKYIGFTDNIRKMVLKYNLSKLFSSKNLISKRIVKNRFKNYFQALTKINTENI